MVVYRGPMPATGRFAPPPEGAWFGAPWPSAALRAPVCDDDRLRVPTPVGTPCVLCDEQIACVDRGTFVAVITSVGEPVRMVPAHIECSFRSVVGGVAHLKGTCTCHGGDDDPDLGHRRRSALEVWMMFHA